MGSINRLIRGGFAGETYQNGLTDDSKNDDVDDVPVLL